MLGDPLRIAFLIGWAFYTFTIYGPSVRRFRRQRVAREATRPLDVAHDMATFVAWQVIPLIYVFSGWPASADYRLPAWAGGAGVVLLAAALFVLRRAYTALGENWSPKLDLREGQRLVTQGIYRRIRHPIYAGMWLWSLSQPLVLQNWIAGWLMLALFAPLYFVRIRREEAMLLEQFGAEYRAYMARTGRVLPVLDAGGWEKAPPGPPA